MKRIRRNISLVLALTMILQVIMPVVVLADNSVQDNSTKVLEETVSEPEDPQPLDPEEPEDLTSGEDDNSSFEGSEDLENTEDSRDTGSENADFDDLEDQDDEYEIDLQDENGENSYQPSAVLDNLVTSFEFSYYDTEGNCIKVENGANIEVNVGDLNAVQLK